jgi:plasmid stabilization system protein ParE
MQVFWRDKAIDELTSIYDYILKETKSQTIATKVYNAILDFSASLTIQPTKYKIEETIGKENVRSASLWSYKLVYTCDNENLYVLRVFHLKQNPNKLKVK